MSSAQRGATLYIGVSFDYFLMPRENDFAFFTIRQSLGLRTLSIDYLFAGIIIIDFYEQIVL